MASAARAGRAGRVRELTWKGVGGAYLLRRIQPCEERFDVKWKKLDKG
jgi:hypothetical protein